jgi:hypothetical protein
VALGLHLAQTFFATPLPSLPALAGSSRRFERARALVARRMAATSAGQVPSFGLLLASELAVRETIGQRLRYLGKQLTPTPRDRAWLHLPRGLGWLRVILRPLRLLTRYGTAYERQRP